MCVTMFAFDLDGTVTCEETLPLLAKELDLVDEMQLLTELTLAGQIEFSRSFRLRYHILKSIPLAEIQSVMAKVRLDPVIVDFIHENQERCAIITGNLDIWIRPLEKALGCMVYSSQSKFNPNGSYNLSTIIDKGAAIRDMKRTGEKVVAVGESFNDIPMFEEADVAISYGGVHYPVNVAMSVSDYVVFNGESLCRLLKML